MMVSPPLTLGCILPTLSRVLKLSIHVHELPAPRDVSGANHPLRRAPRWTTRVGKAKWSYGFPLELELRFREPWPPTQSREGDSGNFLQGSAKRELRGGWGKVPLRAVTIRGPESCVQPLQLSCSPSHPSHQPPEASPLALLAPHSGFLPRVHAFCSADALSASRNAGKLIPSASQTLSMTSKHAVKECPMEYWGRWLKGSPSQQCRFKTFFFLLRLELK